MVTFLHVEVWVLNSQAFRIQLAPIFFFLDPSLSPVLGTIKKFMRMGDPN